MDRRSATVVARHRRVIARLLPILLLAALAVVGVPPAQVAPALAGVSTDGDFSLTKTASPTTVPPGGGEVTYTYTVTNNTAARQFYVSGTDDK